MSDFIFTISYISLQIRHLQMIDKHYLRTILISPIWKKLFTDYQVKSLKRGRIFYVIRRGVGPLNSKTIPNEYICRLFQHSEY